MSNDFALSGVAVSCVVDDEGWNCVAVLGVGEFGGRSRSFMKDSNVSLAGCGAGVCVIVSLNVAVDGVPIALLLVISDCDWPILCRLDCYDAEYREPCVCGAL